MQGEQRTGLRDDRPSAVLTERYRIGAVLGRGGSSTVYAATDLLLGRDVAIKVFAAKAVSEDELRSQQAEAQLLARLNHHALVTLLDAGVDTGDPDRPRIYLVMERASGVDLRARLLDGPLDARQVAFLGFDLAEALQHVHQHGYLHRDVKPANVLLDARGADTRLRGKLTDFGISSIIGAEQGELTTGTAAYLAPEQVEGQRAVPATDVYSLGLVLLEAITGHVEFPGGVLETAAARLGRDPVVPSSVPEQIATVLRGMLARDPGSRMALPEVAVGLQNGLITELVRERSLVPALLALDEVPQATAAYRFDALGDAPDEAFDRVTYLATRLLRTPVAFVALTDADRRTVRSARGLRGSTHDVARDAALCSMPVVAGRPAAVRDVRSDPRTSGNPILVHDARLRSYAAAPLTTHDGLGIGALGVFDRTPRDFDQHELRDLAELAAVIVRELELRVAARRVAFAH